MARIVFLLLLLVNLLFFVWAAGWLGAPDDGHEPERLKAQLQADKMRVAVVGDDGGPAVAEPPPVVAPAAETTAPQTEPAEPPGAADKKISADKPGSLVCRRVGPLPTAAADKLAAAVVGKGGKAGVVPIDGSSYWVFIPANDSKPIEKSRTDLKEAGITDFFVVTGEGPMRGTISLGLFHREEPAKDLLARLARKGIRTAKIDVKPRKTDRTVLEIQGSAELLDQQLAGVSAQVAACPKE